MSENNIKLSCSGDQDGKHPMIYIKLDDNGKGVCMYCGKVFSSNDQ